MGEMAELMIEGTVCDMCGCNFDDGGSPGFPRTCGECIPLTILIRDYIDLGLEIDDQFGCGLCPRMFQSEEARSDHARAKHGGKYHE